MKVLFLRLQELKDYWVKPRVGDIRDKDTIRDLFTDFKPQIVINAAALKHAPLSQIYPRDYVDTNIIGNLNLLEEAKRWECLEKYVFVSTDKIHSKSIMEAQKMRRDDYNSNGRNSGAIWECFWEVGEFNSNLGRTTNQGKPITITDEKMERFMLTIEEAVNLIIKAIEDGQNGKIYILDAGRPIKIIELAKSLISSLGRDIPIK